MKLIVNPHKIQLSQEEAVNEKEIDISKCKFEFIDEITDEYVKEAYFTLGNETYKQIIVNNECAFPQEVLVKPATIELGVVAYLVDNETEIKRYNPTPVYFKTDLGSLKNAKNSQPITPSEMEQYEQALQDGLSEVNDKLSDINTALGQVDNLDIDASKSGTVSTVTITKKNGTTKSVQILDGEQGEAGPQGPEGPEGPAGKDGIDGQDGYSPTASVSKSGSTATITITDKNGTTTANISDGETQDLSNYYTKSETNAITGDLTELTTTVQTNLVSAINELAGKAGLPILENQTIQIRSDRVSSNIDAGIYIVKGASTQIKYGDNYTNNPFSNDDKAIGVLIITDTKYGTNTFRQSALLIKSGSASDELTFNIYLRTRLVTQDLSVLMNINNSQTISGLKTFNTLPESSVTPTTNNQLVNKSYVDTAIASAITDALGGNY